MTKARSELDVSSCGFWIIYTSYTSFDVQIAPLSTIAIPHSYIEGMAISACHQSHTSCDLQPITMDRKTIREGQSSLLDTHAIGYLQATSIDGHATCSFQAARLHTDTSCLYMKPATLHSETIPYSQTIVMYCEAMVLHHQAISQNSGAI